MFFNTLSGILPNPFLTSIASNSPRGPNFNKHQPCKHCQILYSSRLLYSTIVIYRAHYPVLAAKRHDTSYVSMTPYEIPRRQRKPKRGLLFYSKYYMSCYGSI